MNSKTQQIKYLIIGAGLTGLSAAFFLKKDYLVVEADNSPGGTAGTLSKNGFKLDNAIHILYFKQKQIKNWISEELKLDLIEQQRQNSIWIKNRYVEFPLQYHLSKLTLFTRALAVYSIIKTLGISKREKSFNNFEDYSLKVFGKYLTDLFVRPYNEKLFSTKSSEMNVDWMGDYVPTYSKMKMLMSAFGFVDRKYGRNASYYYPSEGGVSTLAQKISSFLEIKPLFNCSLTEVYLSDKTAALSNRTLVKYEHLINTIPLKEFVEKIDNVPFNISESVNKLKKNTTTLLHLMCKGNNTYKFDWIYCADRSIPFYRVTLPGNINPANCPEGHFSITLEYGGDVYQDVQIFNSTIESLQSMGLLNMSTSVIDHHWKLISCGYVIYDKHRKEVLNDVFPFLNSHNIWSVGRYGSWEYSNMEDAISHGKNIAIELMENAK